MPDVEAHEAMKPRLLQQAIDEGLASGPSDRSMDELIADAEGEAADGPAGDAYVWGRCLLPTMVSSGICRLCCFLWPYPCYHEW
jgi:hypothetical protein